MSQELTQWKPPTIAELSQSLEAFAQDDILNMTLSMEPPVSWLKQHPTVKIKIKNEQGNEQSVPLQYIPIEKQRLIAKRLFGMVQIEIKSVLQLFNAICVTVRLHYKHPVSGEAMFVDGVGGVGVQTEAGAVASDMSKIKFDGVMKAAPAAASYAEKNAYDKLGRLFGGEIQKSAIPFDENFSMYAKAFYDNISIEQLTELYELKKSLLSADELVHSERILNNKEKNSYSKLFNLLNGK